MADETKDVTTTSEESERTFTQSELNAILGDRLAQERKKYADYEDLKGKAEKYDADQEAQKSELQKANELAEKYKAQLDELTKANEIRTVREKVASETGVPSNLLTAETEEACKEQAKAFLAWKGDQAGYPDLKDGGEVNHSPGKKTTADQFAAWFDKKLANSGQ